MRPPCGNTKIAGEVAELVFWERAVRMGHVVSKPYGDSAAFDFVVGSSPQLIRVQVRSTHTANPRGRYSVDADHIVNGNNRPLTKQEIDLLAAYILPEDIWYFIPVEAFSPHKNLHFYLRATRKTGDLWRQYRENWWRLGAPAHPPTHLGALVASSGLLW